MIKETLFSKSSVKAHLRKLPSGKVIQVNAYTDKRTKKLNKKKSTNKISALMSLWTEGGEKISKNKGPGGRETSIMQVPAGAAWLVDNQIVKPRTRHLDLGAGRFDKLQLDYANIGIDVIPIDPYNRSQKRNSIAYQSLKDNGGCESATLFNVLNVIEKLDDALSVVSFGYGAIKPGGVLAISVYEGNRKGVWDGSQRNRPLKWYESFVKAAAPDADIEYRGGLMLVHKPLEGEVTFNDYVHGYTPIGKNVAGSIYVHKDYLDKSIMTPKQKELGRKALEASKSLGIKFNALAVSNDLKTVILHELPGFDAEDEPHVNRSVTYSVGQDGELTIKRQSTKGNHENPIIFHGKHQWVAEDYPGFGEHGYVDAEKRYSAWKSADIVRRAGYKLATIGRKNAWNDATSKVPIPVLAKSIPILFTREPIVKSYIPSHTRRLKSGRVVSVRSYTDSRMRNLEGEDRTRDMFDDVSELNDTPEKAADVVVTPRDEIIAEHRRLVDVLESPSHADDQIEAGKQRAELDDYEADDWRDEENWHARTMARMKTLTDSQLRYVIKDATEAAVNAEQLGRQKAGQYRDEAHYASMELRKRRDKVLEPTPAPDERTESINRMVAAMLAGEPIVTVVERVDLKGSNGRWYTGGGFPWGVAFTGEKSKPYFVWQSQNGTTFGKRYPSAEEAQAALDGMRDRKAADFRAKLEGMSPEDFDRQIDYWTPDKSRVAVLQDKLPAEKSPKTQAPRVKRAKNIEAAASADVGNEADHLAEMRVKLQELKNRRYKTAAEERVMNTYERRLSADPGRWSLGMGVSFQVSSAGRGPQINRGFRIIKISPEDKMALVHSVADTGLTSTGGDHDRVEDQWLYLGELKRDKQFDHPGGVAKPMKKSYPILFFKAGPIKNRPGLTLQGTSDSRGHTVKRWKRTAGAEQGSGKPRHGEHNVDTGHAVQFQAGEFKGKGTVTAKGADGVTVKDQSGREHQVRWNEVTGHESGERQDIAHRPLFGDANDLPKHAYQPHDTEEELYQAAEKALPKFKSALAKVTRAMGGKVAGNVEEALKANGPAVVVAPLKGLERARQKVQSDYAGQWNELRDVLRATIKCDSVAELHQAIAGLKQAGIKMAKAPKNRFDHPTPEGYRDALLIVRVPGSDMLAEVQLHLSHVLAAKDAGHEHYGTIRDLHAKYGTDSGPEDHWHADDKAKYQHARNESRRLYSEAWEKARVMGGDMTKALRIPIIFMKKPREVRHGIY